MCGLYRGFAPAEGFPLRVPRKMGFRPQTPAKGLPLWKPRCCFLAAEERGGVPWQCIV